MAARTWDGWTLPDEQAAPEETAMPSRSRAMTAVSACLLVALIETRHPADATQPAAPTTQPIPSTASQLADNQDVQNALQSKAFRTAYLSDARWRDCLDSLPPRGLCVRPIAGLYDTVADPRTEPVDRWPKRIRQTPPPQSYLEQRRALLEKAARAGQTEHNQGTRAFPVGA